MHFSIRQLWVDWQMRKYFEDSHWVEMEQKGIAGVALVHNFDYFCTDSSEI